MTVRSISDQKKTEQESGRKTCREEPAEEESGRKNLPGGACRGRIRSGKNPVGRVCREISDDRC